MEDFHEFWLGRVQSGDDSEPYYSQARQILREGGSSGQSVMSHGDPTLTNIIVEGSEIVDVVDWGCLG